MNFVEAQNLAVGDHILTYPDGHGPVEYMITQDSANNILMTDKYGTIATLGNAAPTDLFIKLAW